MSEQSRIHFCDMAEAHIDELEQENSTLKDRVTELEGIEEDQRMWRGRIQFLEGIARQYQEEVKVLKAQDIALRTLVRAMQALYNQDVGDIVTEQGDRFATVYDMCRVALNERAQQLLGEQKGASHGQ